MTLMTDEEHLREVIREREHTVNVLHNNADAMEKRIWELEARAETAEASARDGWGQRDAIYAELVKVQARAEAAEEKALKEAIKICGKYLFPEEIAEAIRTLKEAKP
jgi:hypothetical protein